MSKTFPSLPHSIPDLRGLWIAIITSLFVLCIKLYVGIITGSYALITDSVHIFIDCSSLGIALLSLTTSKKLQRNNLFTKEKEFSIVQKQILSAKINAILLAVFSIWILLEMFVFDQHSHSEFGHSDHHEHSLILYAAIFGIIAHLVSAFLMRNTTNLAARGAYIHLIADIMSSISIVIATIVMMYTHIEWIDKVLSTFIICFLLYNAQKLYRTTRKKEKEFQIQKQK